MRVDEARANELASPIRRQAIVGVRADVLAFKW